jgi:hypothetical protein
VDAILAAGQDRPTSQHWRSVILYKQAWWIMGLPRLFFIDMGEWLKQRL